MKLADYLSERSLTPSEFARQMNTSRQNVSRWLSGHVPRADEITRVFELTAGRVSPNDFYPLPPPQEAAE